MSNSDGDMNSDPEFIDLSVLGREPNLLHDEEDEEPAHKSAEDNQNNFAPGNVPAETSNEIPAEISTKASAAISTEASTETSTDTSAETANETSTAIPVESTAESLAETSAESPASNLAQELSPYDIIMNELNNFRTGMMTGRVTDISRQSNLDYIQRLDNARQRILELDESADNREPGSSSSSSFRRDVSRARRRYKWTNPTMARTEAPTDNMSYSEWTYSQFIAGLMNTEGSAIQNNPARQSEQNRGTASSISTVNEASSAGPSNLSAQIVSTSPTVNKPTFHTTRFMSDDKGSETGSLSSTGLEAAPEPSNKYQHLSNSALAAAIDEITASFERLALDIARRYSDEQLAQQQDNSSSESEENQNSDNDENAV